MTKFTERVFPKVEAIWASYLEHPFVKGLGEGTLAKEKFQRWLTQDYVYLVEYSKLMALGVAKSTDLSMMRSFSKALFGTLEMEMELHRQFSAQFGISEAELLQTKMWPTNTAYTSYMLNHAQAGGAEYAVTALLTCAWSYAYVGEAVAKQSPENNPYQQWIDMYAGEEFQTLATDMKNLMDKMAKDLPEATLERLEEIIIKTSYYEYQFWTMCYDGEDWETRYEN
ncbi:thiaminase II [Globicatella sp. PHS-GS-PNBC-21-1553]|uniref:thiaminase II n=1 Tax=Globicatella sp. PHS-GS-PNBC-21-1553 TaxID=2885764 RepID=UPI00298F1989|nr:thiaminase II [Globicatella sp. PHS-GS-PNBC-21-1553]WPC08062.1 thiaminase II [Globicatella sp. PHS-GS-PNBC-21-1553]